MRLKSIAQFFFKPEQKAKSTASLGESSRLNKEDVLSVSELEVQLHEAKAKNEKLERELQLQLRKEKEKMDDLQLQVLVNRMKAKIVQTDFDTEMQLTVLQSADEAKAPNYLTNHEAFANELVKVFQQKLKKIGSQQKREERNCLVFEEYSSNKFGKAVSSHFKSYIFFYWGEKNVLIVLFKQNA